MVISIIRDHRGMILYFSLYYLSTILCTCNILLNIYGETQCVGEYICLKVFLLQVKKNFWNLSWLIWFFFHKSIFLWFFLKKIVLILSRSRSFLFESCGFYGFFYIDHSFVLISQRKFSFFLVFLRAPFHKTISML